MITMQKITAHVPADVLRRAQAATGKGITETVRLGLDLLARAGPPRSCAVYVAKCASTWTWWSCAGIAVDRG